MDERQYLSVGTCTNVTRASGGKCTRIEKEKYIVVGMVRCVLSACLGRRHVGTPLRGFDFAFGGGGAVA